MFRVASHGVPLKVEQYKDRVPQGAQQWPDLNQTVQSNDNGTGRMAKPWRWRNTQAYLNSS
jgi:hypothetical protein